MTEVTNLKSSGKYREYVSGDNPKIIESECDAKPIRLVDIFLPQTGPTLGWGTTVKDVGTGENLESRIKEISVWIPCDGRVEARLFYVDKVGDDAVFSDELVIVRTIGTQPQE